MVLVPSLVTRVTSLKKELKETKQTLGDAVVKLVKKVKSLETALKRKSKKVIVSASESEELKDQGRIIQDIDDDPLVSLVKESMKKKSTDFVTPTKASGEAQEEEISPTILRRARSVAKNINIRLDALKKRLILVLKMLILVVLKLILVLLVKGVKRKERLLMVEEDIQDTHKTKEQMRQEEAGLEEAIKLQA
ncbi:hypothetical protein Tco_0119702 [Tanacetum coccineum]